jgi:hypothetical protein
MLVGLQDLCLAGEPEDERPTHRCDMQRLVVLVENEDWSVAIEGHKAITLGRELQGYVTVVALERIGVRHVYVPFDRFADCRCWSCPPHRTSTAPNDGSLSIIPSASAVGHV